MRIVVMMVVVAVMVRNAHADGDSVQASVESMSEADLGRPFNSRFTPITGKEARSLYPSAKAPRKILVNDWRSDFIEVTDVQTLRANARAWGIAKASLDVKSDQRFLIYRVRVVEHVLELDDTTDPRAVDPASGAAFYARKIYFGRMFELVMTGSRSQLSSSVATAIKMSPVTFGVSQATSKYQIAASYRAKGLKPTGEALFARSVDQMKSAYQDKDMGPVVPILVEFRRIPGQKDEAVESIDWTAPSTASQVQPRVRVLSVAGNNSDWTSTGLVVQQDELVFGIATGKVAYAGWGTPPAEPDTKGSGGLEMRIGTTVSAAGKAWMADSQSGELKLRVRDGKYSDNSGAFGVLMIVLPRILLAADCAKLDAQGSETPCN